MPDYGEERKALRIKRARRWPTQEELRLERALKHYFVLAHPQYGRRSINAASPTKYEDENWFYVRVFVDTPGLWEIYVSDYYTGYRKLMYEEDARRFLCRLPPCLSGYYLDDHGFKREDER